MANEDLISSSREAMILRHWHRSISGRPFPGAERMEFYDSIIALMLKILHDEIRKLGYSLEVEYGPGPKQGVLTVYMSQQLVLTIPFQVNEYTGRFVLKINRPENNQPIIAEIDRRIWERMSNRYRNEQIKAIAAKICHNLKKESGEHHERVNC